MDQIKEMLKLLIIILCQTIILSCVPAKTEQEVLRENIELKDQVYNDLNNSLNQGDSLITFNELSTIDFDSILIFPSYTSMQIIEPYLEGVVIEKYEKKQMVQDNEDLLLFTRDREIIAYIILDTLFVIPDLQNDSHSYARNTVFKLRPFQAAKNIKGAYLIPLTGLSL